MRLPIHFLTAFKDRDDGAEIVEFALVLLPMLAIIFLIIDMSWLFFAKATIQHAAEEGVRYAVTGTPMKNMGLDSSVKTLVQQDSMGFLAGASGLNNITVRYYSQSNLTQPLSGAGATAGGNIVQISIDNVYVSPFGPIFRSAAPIVLSAIASDVMEPSPNGVPPPE